MTRLVFSGSGGQGIITTAVILAEAAVYHEGLNAVQTQMYGPEARGGAARSDVIISCEEIRFPKVIQPDILVCLSQEAYNRYYSIVRPGGLLLTDTHYVKQKAPVDARQVELDLYKTVLEVLGSSLGMNSCLLGALAGLLRLVGMEALEKTMASRFSERYRETNIRALRAGYELVKDLGESLLWLPGGVKPKE